MFVIVSYLDLESVIHFSFGAPPSDYFKITNERSIADADLQSGEYEVADLSAIPTPKIEFVMPNLTPLESGKKELLSKEVKKSKKAKPSSSTGETLNSELLNTEIVHLRSVVQKAQKFLIQRLVRKMKRMEAILAKKANNALKRKIARYEEEIHFLKSIKKDEVSKFALLNKKTLNELNITDRTAVKDRCLFKLACEPPVLKAIESFRSRYPSWEVTTAFLLQRLGLQYASLKTGDSLLSGDSEGVDSEESEKDAEVPAKEVKSAEAKPDIKLGKRLKTKVPSVKKECKKVNMNVANSEEIFGDGSDESSEHSECDDDDEQIGSGSDDDEQAAKHRRELLLGPTASSSKRKKPQHEEVTKVAERKPSVDETPTTAVVKKINLSEAGGIKLNKRLTHVEHRPKHKDVGNNVDSEPDSFFLPPASVSTFTGQLVGQPTNRSEAVETTERETIRLSDEHSKPSIPKGNTVKKKKLSSKAQLSHSEKANTQENIRLSEDLHPSWAARRQAKDRQLSAPQGKRIVFEDD
ncbi:unnamed protein product [Strongylus vulgaris]|uniref:Serum response factor-binding protein 1 n=1 Tax=Strongylus vulgaris TaxID=40348 RepID=A0A3P7IZR9_STRVU|nr:unnamed protein product [Strongylus vulgaris]